MALIVALLVVAIVTLLATTVSVSFSASFRQSEQLMASQQSWPYLEFSEDVAMYLLQADLRKLDERVDHLSENWNEPFIYDLRFNGVDVGVEGQLWDLQGRINLNQLAIPAKDNQRFSVYQQRFIRLLQCFDNPVLSESEAIEIAEAVIDWVDTNNEITGQAGAEDLYYVDLPLSGKPGNAIMASSSELRWVKGMTAVLFEAIEPYVTVWPMNGSSTLNMNTASPVVLRTLNQNGDLRPLDENDVLTVIEDRGETGWTDLSIFDSSILAGINIDKEGLSLRSSYFMLDSEIRLGSRVFRMSSVLNRGSDRMQVLARSRGGW